MATHDYVIDNSTGANVRSDLNSVLQAILSNNSNSSAPSTTAAYMWWADTTNGVLKIRNSANNAWVELLQLDGTLTLEDGSVSAPALAFRDDLNTGIFSSAADTFNIATAGVERMELGATTIFNEDGADVDFRIEGDTEANLFYVDAGNDRIGIGTSSPDSILHLVGTGSDAATRISIKDGSGIANLLGRNGNLAFQSDTDNAISGSLISFAIDGTERIRIDSSGRLLLGTTTEGYSGADDLTISTSGDTGLSIRSGTTNQGTIAFSDGTSGADEYRGYVQYLHNGNALLLGTDATERMRIDSSGKVGIGTSSPDQKLHIYHATDNGLLHLESGDSQARIKLKDNAGETHIGAVGNDTVFWQTSSLTQSFKISGTNGRLERGFSGGGSTDDDAMWFVDNDSTSGTYIRFWQTVGGAHQIGSISHGTSSTSYNTSSDYRLKENVVAIFDGITRLKTLKPSRFNFKNDTDTTVDGFLAHEVTAVPEAITGTKDEVDSDNNPVYQGIDQSKIVPLLTAALQEAIAKIEVLETKVAALEAA